MAVRRAVHGNTMACVGIISAASAIVLAAYSIVRELRQTNDDNTRGKATTRANGWDYQEA